MDELFDSIVKKINKVPYDRWEYDDYYVNRKAYKTSIDDFEVNVVKFSWYNTLFIKKNYYITVSDKSCPESTKKFEGKNGEIKAIYTHIENGKENAKTDVEKANKEKLSIKEREFEKKLTGYFAGKAENA